MKFILTAAAMQIVAFEALNEGIWVTEQELQNNENILEANAGAITAAANALEAAQAEKQTLVEALAEATAQLETKNTELETLQARITELENAPAGSFASTAKDKDDIGGSGKKVKSPVDAEADRLRAMRA